MIGHVSAVHQRSVQQADDIRIAWGDNRIAWGQKRAPQVRASLR